MKKVITIVFAIMCLQSFATVRLVPSQYSTIQSALNAAKADDTILVAKGIYRENIIWPQTNNLHLISDIPSKNSAIIGGRDSGRVININWLGSNTFKVEINGFVIQHGFVNVPAHQGGRGAGIFAANAVLSISNCVFTKNKIEGLASIQNSGSGAGLHIEATPVGYSNTIFNCAFTDNSISEVTNGWGTAIDLDNAPADINKVTINNNTMSIDDVADGTVYAYQSRIKINDVKIENNFITTNESILQGAAAIKGGALFIYLSDAIITNLLADNNQLTPQNTGLALLGSGIYFYGEGSTLKMSNSTIANNIRTDSATVNGAAVYYSTTFANKSDIYNSIFWNPGKGSEIYNQEQVLTVSFTDVRTVYNGDLNMNVNPEFVSSNDFHLRRNSPCINAGDNSAAPPKDLDGTDRPTPKSSNADLGCYENTRWAYIASATTAKSFDQSIHIYPNPSKGIFKLSVDESFINSNVKLINTSGKIAFHGKIESVDTDYNFDKLSNGVYHLIITNDSHVERNLKLVIFK